MGLFDGFVDPQQFKSGGGLLGRLLAMPQMQGVYQPDGDVGATSAPPTLSVPPPLPPGFASLPTNGAALSPATSYQAFQPFSGSQPPTLGTASSPIGPASASQPLPAEPNFASAGGGYEPVNSGASPASQNTLLAQYSPAITPVGIPLPPVFIPGTSENNAFVHSTIAAGRAIGTLGASAVDGLGALILNNENAERPPAGSRSINQTPWSGDHRDIKRAVGADPDDDVRISPTGEVWAQNPDGSWTNHGAAETFTGSGKPSGRRGKDRDRWR
jgi:hypothetical protein